MRLLEDRHHPDGRVVLALSTGAANLFLRSLDLDIEDGQIATEAIVRTQLARGKFDLDVVGHYARPDIFQLHVDDRPKHPVITRSAAESDKPQLRDVIPFVATSME